MIYRKDIMKKLLYTTLLCSLLATTVASVHAVTLDDLESARGYSYMYRMHGQRYYSANNVAVYAGEGTNYEIVVKTYSHQGAMYYMTEYVNHYYFNQEADTIHWKQDEINIIDARTGEVLRKEYKTKSKPRLLKADTYGYEQAIYYKNLAIAAGQLK